MKRLNHILNNNMRQVVLLYAVLYTLSIRSFFVTPYEHNNGFKPDGDNLRVLVNDTAQIKCDVGSNLADDKVLLVVWYKNNLPIYSYDTRGAHAGTPSHWRDDEVLEDRAIFRTHKEPAELIINPVKEKDSGNFRCRVDFKKSQTRNSNINLEVVVPPQKPNIFDEHRMRIDLRAGPYEEGGNLELTCVVYGGSPPPLVNWLLNGQPVNSISDNSFEGTINSKLVVHNLSRNHQHATYTCQASNFHEKYVSANVTIELYLRPMLVEITVTSQPMSADRKYEIECRALGSRPPAKISWWISNIELENYTQNVSSDGNMSTSILNIKPSRDDHGKPLYCRAINTFVRNGLQETSMKLNVFFTPSLQLDLGSNLNPEDIEEGDDVYFECKVHANPAAYKVVWKHNNQIIQHNQRAGVIVSSGDLALQGVTQHLAGNYTCTASNVEGDGDSNVVQLKVMYKPICRTDQKTVYGVARNEEAQISCEVDAFPAPESFKWSFNNTAETFDMPQSGFERHSAQGSTLKYTPVKEMDFGTIMCWADNNVGQQKEPCVFHLIAAGKPAIPHNCSVVNQTAESLEINCIEGFDGGLRQWFSMEIYDKHSGTLHANISSKYPIFGASGLDGGHVFKVFIYAINARGKSEPVQIETFTKIGSEKQKIALISYKGSQGNISITPLLSAALLLAICSALICLSVGTIMAFKLRTYKQRQKYHHQQSEILTRPASLQVKEKLSPALAHSEEIFDDRNPDVVPDKKDSEIKQISSVQTPPTVLLSNNTINMNKQLTNKYTTYIDNENFQEEDVVNSDTLRQNRNTNENLKSRSCQVTDNKRVFSNSITINVCGSNISKSSYTATSPNTKSQHTLEDTVYNSPPNTNCRSEFSNFNQLDHLKLISGKTTGSIHPNVVTPVLKEVSTCLSPAVAQICAIFPPSGALQPPGKNLHSFTIPDLQQEFSTTDQINNSFRMMINEDMKFQYGSLNMTPTYKQDILGPILIGNNTVNFTSISPSNSLTGLSSSTKTFSREIVTVRTPLMYSQQESCV